jgi:hypothetical protein
MKSAEIWNKLLLDLCDNSNRKIFFAPAVYFRKICREDGHSGEMPWRNLVAQPDSPNLRKTGKDVPARAIAALQGGHTLVREHRKKRCGTILFQRRARSRRQT